ncbi:MAG: polymorphic toxin type 50 domain-containing protein [Candidatus Copromonas sp.]|nr:polymorphic toxin type 50 domain-containing protein [Candidatus Copromonas sp.]
MAMKIRPPEKADVTALLRNLFLRTEQELIREITRKRAAGHVEYAEVAALERVQKILQNMVNTSWSYVPVMIEKIFYHSDKDAAGYANARSMTGTYSVTQIALMEHLANNLQGELVEMAGTAKRSVESVFTIARLENDPYRKLTLEQILRQEAAGKPWIRTSEDLIKEMETNGITGFTDKAGRRWSMQAYGNMAVRTTARQAEVAALLSSDEYDLWQITKVGTTCPVCAPLEGRVYSKSGTNPDYPPLTVAFGKVDPAGADDLSNTYLNIHPNCLHALVKYTTIGKSAERIQKDKDFSSIEKNPLNRDPRTKKQIAAYREKERNRQKLLRDMKQHKEYRAILGNDIPKDFAKFRELKYNNSEKWDKFHSLYQDDKLKKKIRSPEVNKTIEEGKQGKHILGHKNYKDGRSYLKVSAEEAQRLVDQYAGTGQIKRDSKGHWTNKEFVSADHIIGVVVDANMGETIETSRFSIHYSKNGVHIVPRKE